MRFIYNRGRFIYNRGRIMYKKGGNQKKGAKFGTFFSILYIKKNRLYIFRTRLYIIRISDKMRNRSVAHILQNLIVYIMCVYENV